tara:strand:- start:2744 stop:2971 length:228 start_codon:yes stop_codon:yes gene_type:complete
MKYKFDEFKTEIDNPTVAVSSVTDNMNNTCNVGITLTTPDVKMYGVTFDGFTYGVTWEDADIEAFVTNTLIEYEV